MRKYNTKIPDGEGGYTKLIHDKIMIGLIADEVAAVQNNFKVAQKGKSGEYDYIEYFELVPAMLKELQKLVKKLKDKGVI